MVGGAHPLGGVCHPATADHSLSTLLYAGRMGCASSSPLPAGASPPLNDERASSGDSTVAGKVRQTVTGMADALPVQDLIDGVNHAKDEALHKIHGNLCCVIS